VSVKHPNKPWITLCDGYEFIWDYGGMWVQRNINPRAWDDDILLPLKGVWRFSCNRGNGWVNYTEPFGGYHHKPVKTPKNWELV
jgi:hypothetical protein